MTSNQKRKLINYRYPVVLLAVLVLLVLVILAGGFWFYSTQEQHHRETSENQLLAIAQLKADQITQWRQERMADASTLVESPFFAEAVSEWLSSPDAELKGKILTRFRLVQKYYAYQDILLVDPNGKVLLTLNNTVDRLSDISLAQLPTAVRERRAVFVDFHSPPGDHEPHLDIIAPLFTQQKGGQQATSALVLCIDPSQYLHPLIQSWPMPSDTAETLLVRREGDQVLFLNELRHQKDTALKLRIPLTQTEVPAVTAVSGKEGIVEGRDYRGVEVLAALKKIPDSPWFMVAKMDTAETFSAMRFNTTLIISLIIGLLAIASIVGVLVWQRQQRLFYKTMYLAEVEREALLRHFEYLVKYANDIIILLDENNRIIEVNDRALQAYGYTREEMYRLPGTAIIAPEDIPAYQERLQETVGQGKDSYLREGIHIRKDGSRFPMEASVRLVEVEGKRYLQAIIRDITKRKQAEAQLRTANRLYALLSDINQAIVRTRERQELFQAICRIAVETGKFRMAWIGWLDEESGCVKPVTHYGYEEGHLQTTVININDPAQSRVSVTRAIKEGKLTTVDNIETEGIVPLWQESALKRGYRSLASVPIKLKDKVVGNFTIIADTPWFFTDEERKLMEEIGTDISYALDALETESEREQAEEALRRSEEKFKSIINTAPIGIGITINRVIEEASSYLCELTGYSREELLGKSPRILYPTDDDFESVRSDMYRQIAEKGINHQETHWRHKNGKLFEVLLSAVPLRQGDPSLGLTFTALDITQRRHLEEERQRAAKLESVGLLAGGIAHDFNNILTAILGNISLARMETKPGEELHARLTEAEKASLRARDLTQQLLTFAKGGAPVKKTANITELIRDTATFALRGSNVRCEFSIPADLWSADVDQGQISQVINNLVINAQQAMPAGGTIEIRAENIRLTGQQSLGKNLPLKQGDYIRISVADHGTGIPAEYLEKIFDPYFTTKQKGSGLGLASSYSIVRNHGGHIGLESKMGAGSTFYVYLPAAREKTPIKQEKAELIAAGSGRILLMDDEASVREVAGRMLKHIGYEDVQLATDGAEAIKIYKEAMDSGKPFAAVILDLTIPGGMGGRETMTKLLEIDPNVKAIVSSGYSNESVAAEYREYGFRGVVGKPYTLEQLRKGLHEALS